LIRTATLSQDRRYRYVLRRDWSGVLAPTGYAMVIGLNPSTADETVDDPTIRRCIAFAQAWGYSGLCMANLFAFRATQPKDMFAAEDPVGPDNNDWLLDCAAGAAIVVAAWGAHGTYRERDTWARASLGDLHYLRLTKDGHPGHPLYLPKDLRPARWNAS